MSHEINYNKVTRKYASYSVREIPWHSLGHVAQGYEYSTEVIVNAQLNFPVIKAPHRLHLPSGNNFDSPRSFYTFRGDTEEILGHRVGCNYTVVQNIEAFQFFDDIAGAHNIRYETAGALFNGSHIFITAKLPSCIRVDKDDVLDNYLFLTNGHDGESSITVGFTPIRIVCNNTLNAALRNCSNIVRIRHTTDVHHRLKEAHRVMKMVNTAMPATEQRFQRWAKIRVTDAEVKKLIQLTMADKETVAKLKAGQDELISVQFKNTVAKVMDYAMGSSTQQLDTTAGTLFGAYNAITGYHQNVKHYDSKQHKVKSLLLGGEAQLKGQRGFDLCAAFEANGSIIFTN